MADKQQQEFQKILLDLLALPENKVCADCHAKGPRWASSSLGVFICIKCSGIHRGMGTHISFVRSVTLDKWTPQQIKNMQQMGNARAAEIYEANVPQGHVRPTDGDSYGLEQWIRAKYERKQFMRKEGAATPKEKRKTRKPNKTAERAPPKEENLLSFDSSHSHSSSATTTPSSTQFFGFPEAPQRAPAVLPPAPSVAAVPPTTVRPRAPSFEQAPTPSLGFHAPAPTTSTPVNSTTRSSAPANFDDAFFGGGPEALTTPNKGISKQSILDLYNTPAPTMGSSYGIPQPMQPAKQSNGKPGSNYDIVMPGLGMPATPTYPTGSYGVMPQQAYGMSPGYVNPGYGVGPQQYGNMQMGVSPPPGFVNTNGYVNANYLKNTSNSFTM